MLFSLCLAAQLTFACEDPALQHASLGAYAVDMRTGEVLLDEGGDRSLLPASCVKVITTAAALSLLDPEEHIPTLLEYEGEIDVEGVLHGTLYIRGNGDPCLGSARSALSFSWQQQIALWIEAVKEKGIRRIEGDVIGDASLWETVGIVPSWAWEDVGNYYGAGASALSFHENCYDLIFQPGETVGKAVSILRTDPPQEGFSLINSVTAGPEGSGDCACIYGQVVQGTIPVGVSEFTIRGALPNPPLFCAHSLKKALQEQGVFVGEKVLKQGKRTLIHTTLSPPVSEIVYWTNQKSINLYAEHLLKKMGERKYGEGSTEAGLKAVRSFLQKEKISLCGMKLVDGSGLSRQNLVTAKQFVSLLSACRKEPFYPVFKKSLPHIRPGVMAKTGSMASVRGLVGYAGEVAFAIVVNCAVGIDVKERIDRFLDQLVEEKRL